MEEYMNVHIPRFHNISPHSAHLLPTGLQITGYFPWPVPKAKATCRRSVRSTQATVLAEKQRLQR